nr:long chain fatty acid coenzyme A ligase 5 [Hymenolepis microstoma]
MCVLRKEGVRRSAIAKYGDLPVTINGNIKTVHDLLLYAVRISGCKSFLGSQEQKTDTYIWITFKDVYDRANTLGSGLINVCGLNKNVQENFIGICGRNCVEWVVAEFACATYGLVAVPIYDALSGKTMKFICDHSELTVCICISSNMVRKFLKMKISRLKHIILVESDEWSLKELRDMAHGRVQIHAFADIMAKGREMSRTPYPSNENDRVCLCYTSGTTGTPKGVIITNKMLISTVSGALFHGNRSIFTERDVYLSYMPLAHIYEQFNLMLALSARGKVGFSSGDIKNFQEDMLALQPTILFTVPSVLTWIQKIVYKEVDESKLKTALLEVAIKQKLEMVSYQNYDRNSIWDKLIFRKIRKSFGGRIRIVNVGGAPISDELLRFTRAVFCCPVFEGYGATETCGAITCSLFSDMEGNHVGPPLPGCEIKLINVPKMNLNPITDNIGEVCVRGAVTTPGYYKQPELTANLIDKDGWLHMGDIGEWTEYNQLKIVDRLKHIFKLAQGEYVVPGRVEQVYSSSSLVNQIFVDGSPLKPYPIALVVPDGDSLCKALNRLDQNPEFTRVLSRPNSEKSKRANAAQIFNLHGTMVTMEQLCTHPDAEKIVLEKFKKLAKNSGLKDFEQVRVLKLVPEAFSLENRLLTPTLKCARHAIRRRYQGELKELYSRNELP